MSDQVLEYLKKKNKEVLEAHGALSIAIDNINVLNNRVKELEKELESKHNIYKYRYDQIKDIVSNMGGWANFSHYMLKIWPLEVKRLKELDPDAAKDILKKVLKNEEITNSH
jgi:hypothetical protein